MTTTQPDISKINDFWRWFSASCSEISALIEESDAHAISDLITPRISALQAGLGWEIGPWKENVLFLAFTLNGLQENIAIAERIIEAAPRIPGWEAVVGKPLKEWDGKISMLNSEGHEIHLDSSKWCYVLTGYDGNQFFDIQIMSESLPLMDESAKKQAAIVVTESYLGERTALELIGDADLTAPIPPELAEQATPIAHLKDHLDYLRS